MVAKFLTFFGLVAAAAAIAIPVAPVSKLVYAQPEAPAQYDFSYSVHDSQTGDIKQQQESRRGDAVQGSYSLLQPDGVHRIVEYTADEHQGFNAIVRYEGTPVQAAPVAKIAYAAPIAKVAYSQAPITYAAPAPVTYAQAPAQISYGAAPIGKLAYSENLGRVSFSSPIISYQH